MDIVKNAKEIGSEIEKGIETGFKKSKAAFANVASHLPFVNLAKKDECNYSIEVDLPGVKKEDIDINVDGNKLNILAIRRTNKEVKEEDYYLRESFYGKIARTFILPEDIDTDNIEAKLEDGRLYLEMNKIETAQPKNILIK